MKPIVIVGLGLAGACTAWHLWHRGVPFQIVDRGVPGSSHVAAGLIHAVTGKQCAVAEDFLQRREEAECFYQAHENLLGEKFWHPLGVIRLLSQEEARKKLAKFQTGDAAEWVEGIDKDERWPDDLVVLLRGGARLDVRLFLQATREFFLRQGCLEECELLEPKADARTVYCEGAAGLIRGNPVAWRHRSARGEILTVRAPEWKQQRLVTGRGWLVPVGGGLYKVGATYAWDYLERGPSEEGRERLERMAHELGGDGFEVIQHECGVRPILRQSQPVAGEIRMDVWVLNGLGSKGSLYAPWAAGRLVDALVDGKPLESALSVHDYFANLPQSR